MGTQEKIQVRTIKLATNRVASVSPTGEPAYEKNTISLSAGLEWENWLTYARMHGYKSMQVVGLLNANKEAINDDELIASYQLAIDNAISVKQQKSVVDELAEQKTLNQTLMARLEALEAQVGEEKAKPGRKPKQEQE